MNENYDRNRIKQGYSIFSQIETITNNS